ncbi:MAG: DUF3160 domain-containing protein [Opitutaceae bacterium]|jgi:hypothetical protein|nr:DUF3160 domain-containing protein [Opitutaceae bacterium]
MFRPSPFRPPLFLLTFALACALASLTQAQRGQRPADELTPAQREQLQRDKLIIGSKNYTQIFSPYITLGKSPDSIRFITSDAALAAYHALFEDSFRELELRRAARLRGDIEKLYNACKPYSYDKKPTYPPALIQLILGPALAILGSPVASDNFSETLIPEINRQTALIRAAEIEECPPWLDYNNDDPYFKIDYRRCAPVSFYADNSVLADYHRVTRWLQLAPLRATNDDELAAWARMVHISSIYIGGEHPDFTASFTGLSVFAGPIADRTIIVNNSDIRDACFQLIKQGIDSGDSAQNKAPLLARLREVLHANAFKNPARSSINDEIRSQPKKDESPLPEIRFRVMPAHALPDAEILSACLGNGICPNGLTIAAFLGSVFARERMPKIANNSKWVLWNKHARQLMFSQDGEPRSLYADYIDLLRALNAPPIKEAPAFMRSLPWQIKTCQTQLASWAQIRHTYTLQAKFAVRYGGMEIPPPPPPGFVEPNPVFWREYVRLVERTISLLDAETILTPPVFEFVRTYRAAADEIETAGLTNDDATLDILKDRKIKKTLEKARSLMWFDEKPQTRKFLMDLLNLRFATPGEMRTACKRIVVLLRSHAGKIERGEAKPRYEDARDSLATRWNTLVTLSRQLETILAKQLDEIELTNSERSTLIEYGYIVASAMGYLGAAGDAPRDTAPRWAEVAHDPNAGQSLAAATGRARALYVLYPWRGRELLCTGAVLSYYEEWSPTKRLTDEEWKAKLDSPAAPPPPDWLAPILAR